MITLENKQGVANKKIAEYYLILVVAICGLSLDLFLNRLMAKQSLNEQKTAVTQRLGTIRAQLEERLNSNLYILYGMASHISIQPDTSEKEFQMLSQVLLSQSSTLKNIAAAPDFIIKYIYPIEGNEAVVGLNYRENEEQWPMALAAKKTGDMVIAGPLNLVQGGTGIIARIPVFIKETGVFWGLVSSVIDFDLLMKQSGVNLQKSELNVAIRYIKSKGDYKIVFPHGTDLFKKENNAVVMPVSLPSVSWEMAALPKNGWRRHPSNSLFLHLSILIATIIICFVIFQRAMNKQVLIENEAKLKAMSKASHDSLIMINANDRITFWNPSAEKMFGYTEAEILGKQLHDIVTLPLEREQAKTGLKDFAQTGQGPIMNQVRELTAIRKSGHIFPVELSVSSFRYGGMWYAVGNVRDITGRKKHEEQLTFLATTDGLTRLCNRRYFLDLSEMEFKKAVRYRKNLSLAVFDIDHFKRINDTYGHDAGDQVLQALAQMVSQNLRETDIIGRIGGEEFALTMPETPLHHAENIAERIRLNVMEMKVKTGTTTISISISIGIANINTEIQTLAELMKEADKALYKAKADGRNKVVAAETDQSHQVPPFQ